MRSDRPDPNDHRVQFYHGYQTSRLVPRADRPTAPRPCLLIAERYKTNQRGPVLTDWQVAEMKSGERGSLSSGTHPINEYYLCMCLLSLPTAGQLAIDAAYSTSKPWNVVCLGQRLPAVVRLGVIINAVCGQTRMIDCPRSQQNGLALRPPDKRMRVFKAALRIRFHHQHP